MVIIALLLIMIVTNIILIILLLKSKKTANTSDTNIMKEILDKVSTNELNFVDSSAVNIIQVLKKNYKIDYCTILIGSSNSLDIIATDIEDIYRAEITQRCNELLSKTKGRAIINSSEETYLDYPSAIKRTIRYSYFIPLGSVGALYIENYSDYKDNNFEIDFFNTVIKNIGIILQNCIYQDKLSNLAMKDNLTGLYNRNYMSNHIEILKKQNKSLVLAIMDIDHFKSVNDTYGHDFGDVVLKQASNFIKSKLVKNIDEIYRWGGEEFIISFVGQELEDTVKKLDRIREELSCYLITDGKTELKITASFGIATFDKELTLDQCIKKADSGLYVSKSNGRNQINIGE